MMASSSFAPPSDDDEDELGAFIYNTSRTAKRRAALEERDGVGGGTFLVLSSPTTFTTVGIDACHSSDSNNNTNNGNSTNNNDNNINSDPTPISPLSSQDPITSAMDSDLGRQQLSPGGVSQRSPSSSPPQGTKQVISTPEAMQEHSNREGNGRPPTPTRNKPACSTEGCPDFAIRGGVCTRHGATKRKCSHDRCTGNAKQGDVCVKNGATVKNCVAEGCTNQARRRGVYNRHTVATGTMTTTNDQLAVKGGAYVGRDGDARPEETRSHDDGGPRGAECVRKECADLADEVGVHWRHHIANLKRRHPSRPIGADDGGKEAIKRTSVPSPSGNAVLGGSTSGTDEGGTDVPEQLSFSYSPSPSAVVFGGEGAGGANDGGIDAIKRRCVPSLGGNLVVGSNTTGTDEGKHTALPDHIGFGGPSSFGKRMFADEAVLKELGDGKPSERGVVEPATVNVCFSSAQVSQGSSGGDDDDGGDGCAAAQRQTNFAGVPNQDGNVEGVSTTEISGNGCASSNNFRGNSDGSTFIQLTMMTEQNSLGKIPGTPPPTNDGMLKSEEHMKMMRYFREWSLAQQLMNNMSKALETFKGPDLGNAGYDGVSTNSNHAVMGRQMMSTVPKYPRPDLDNPDHCGGSSNSNSATIGNQAMKQLIRDAAGPGGSSSSNQAAMGNQTTGSMPNYPETLKRPALDSSFNSGNYNSHTAIGSQTMAKTPDLSSTSHGADGFDSTHSAMGSDMIDGMLHCPGNSMRPTFNNGDHEGSTTDSSHATMESYMMIDSISNATGASKQPTLGNGDRGGPISDIDCAAMGIMMMVDKGTAPVTSVRPALGNDNLNSPYSKIIRASKSLGLQKYSIHKVPPTPGTSERLAAGDVHRYSSISEIVRDAKSLGNRKCSIDEISLTIEQPALGDAHRCSPTPEIICESKSLGKRKFDEIPTRCGGDEGVRDGMCAKKALLQRERIVHLEESKARLDRVVKDSPMACRHVGCANQIVNCGLCRKHGAISRPKMCTHFGCMDRVEDSDVCIRHSTHSEICTHERCSNQAKKKGVCKLHRAERKTCSHEGCNNFCVNGELCIKHGAKFLKVCGLEGCTNGAIKGDVCWKCVHAAWAK